MMSPTMQDEGVLVGVGKVEQHKESIEVDVAKTIAAKDRLKGSLEDLYEAEGDDAFDQMMEEELMKIFGPPAEPQETLFDKMLEENIIDH